MSEVEEDEEIDVVETLPGARRSKITARNQIQQAAAQSKATTVKPAAEADGADVKKPFKRVKHMDYLEMALSRKFLPDGSMPRDSAAEQNPWSILPSNSPFERHINRFSSLCGKSMQPVRASDIPHDFKEYGPYHLRDTAVPPATTEDLLYFTYVDTTGEAYAKSLVRFADSIGPRLRGEVDSILQTATRGAYGISNAVQVVVAESGSAGEGISATAKTKVETEMGTLDVAAMIHDLKTEPERTVKEAELEVYRREGIDINPILKPAAFIQDPDLSRELTTATPLRLLLGNVQDLMAVEKLKAERVKAGQEQMGKEESEKAERVRRRLLELVKVAPPAEFEGAKGLPSVDTIQQWGQKPNLGGSGAIPSATPVTINTVQLPNPGSQSLSGRSFVATVPVSAAVSSPFTPATPLPVATPVKIPTVGAAAPSPFAGTTPTPVARSTISTLGTGNVTVNPAALNVHTQPSK
ncbi:hypothetical protein HDV00_011881 [Rhizophlyctis rosea]|nr:hypothetical protein HDV00_011881 [Rhizophlyctis rosea]